MPHWVRWVLLGFILLLLASWPLAMTPDTGAIEGWVTNELGPIAKASVEASHSVRGGAYRGWTGEDGHYLIENLRPGAYDLWVTAPDHCWLQINRIIVTRGGVTRRDVRLARVVQQTCREQESLTKVSE